MSHGRLGPPTVQVKERKPPGLPLPNGRGPRPTSQENQVPLESPVSEVSPNSKIWSFPVEASGKEPTCQFRRQKRCGFDPWVEKISWRRAWQPFPVFLPGKSHGQSSLAGRPQSMVLQRTFSPNTITLRAGASAREFWKRGEGNSSVHSTGVSKIFFLCPQR